MEKENRSYMNFNFLKIYKDNKYFKIFLKERLNLFDIFC